VSGDPGIPIQQYAVDEIMRQEYRSLTMLWEKAVQWVMVGDGRQNQWVSHHFRSWWLRAALARGHAEWLLQEQENNPGNRVKHVDQQRLLPPASIAQYDNDCGVYTLLSLTKRKPDLIDPITGLRKHDPSFPAYSDDAFNSVYNITQTLLHEIQNSNFGWPHSSTLYGAPVGNPFLNVTNKKLILHQDFVFRDFATTGSLTALAGFLPQKTKNITQLWPVDIHARYLRQGLRDFLPGGTSAYELDLAACADAIILEIEAEAMLPQKQSEDPELCKSSEELNSILDKILNHRLNMRAQDAEERDFDGVVYRTLKRHVSRIHSGLRKPHQYAEHIQLLSLEQKLAVTLSPWFTFKLLETGLGSGQLVIHLRSLTTGRLCQEDPTVGELSNIAIPVHQCLEARALIYLDKYLEAIRDAIIGGGWIGPDIFRFVLPYRSFLESGGDPNLMPKVNGKVPDMTILELYRKGRIKCKAGCLCPLPKMFCEKQDKAQCRQSNNPRAMEERATIREFFEMNRKEGLGITPDRLGIILSVVRR
jgi:hypothetical protein